jgi:hypothetical protein
MSFIIRTNHRPRAILSGYELTAKERAEFDYLDDEEKAESRFVRYRAWVYDLGDMMAAPEDMRPWQAIGHQTYFSGVVFRYVEDNEMVICGNYYATDDLD